MGRCVWVRESDVNGTMEPGSVVTARHALDDWCLRDDDEGEPVATGAALEVIETRPWGAAMAEELPLLSECDDEVARLGGSGAIIEAGIELAAQGLFEWIGL